MLYDKSTTGTFINGRLVGKGNCQPLVNGDIIGMRTSDSNAFRYVSAYTYFLKACLNTYII